MATIAEAFKGMLSPEELNKLLAVVTRQEQRDGIETVTSGALSLLIEVSKVSVTGTQAYTLANGTFEGQRKNVRVTAAASTPNGTLTPTTFADGTSINLDAVGEEVELEWHSDGWHVVSISGATITP